MSAGSGTSRYPARSGQQQYGALADRIARKHGIDPGLFRRLISAESGWNFKARSPAGAIGLTQIVPKWHPDANLSTPAGQLEAGASYLQSGLRKYGNPRDALSQYNSGRPWSRGQNIPETRAYVSKILGGYTPAGSGGRSTPDAATGAAASSPVAASLQQIPALDGKRLMGILNAQKARVLRGEMPSANYTTEIQKVLRGVAPRQQIASTVQSVGAGVAMAGSAAGKTAGDIAVAAGQAIVAKQIPYSWGGGTTSGPTRGFGRGAKTVGFDCSSFAQYMWAKAGVSIPRTTYGQIKVGAAVPSIAQAKPGDLLFPHAGHVQIYIGNGQVIEEPRTGGHAQVAPVRSKYLAIRRPG